MTFYKIREDLERLRPQRDLSVRTSQEAGIQIEDELPKTILAAPFSRMRLDLAQAGLL